jgi:hypothetical protein
MDLTHHIAIDFETYYGTGCDIRSLGMSQYVQHPEFEVMLMGYQTPSMPEPECLVGHDECRRFFNELRPYADKISMSAHNIMFDGYVASHLYDFVPGFYYCTSSMANALLQQFCDTSLAGVAKFLKVTPKIEGVLGNMRNKRWGDLTPEEKALFIEYCKGDILSHWEIFQILSRGFPEAEFRIIDMITRMFNDPILVANKELAEKIWKQEIEDKKALCKELGVPKTTFTSNDKFAALLEERGYDCPMKWSEKKEKYIPAVAANDMQFIALEDYALEAGEDELARLIHARKRIKSNIIETRSKAFIDRSKHPIPIGIRYCAAHTMRFGGTDKFNPQNLPNTDIRNCLCAPPGYELVIVDAAQIEARINAWLAGQEDLVNQFMEGADVYSIFASMLFGFAVNKKDHYTERYIGKTCLAAGSQVLTRRGWVPIIEVQPTDELWDGVEWVSHQGVSCMGQKQTIWLHGLELTADHGILTAPTRWDNAQFVLENPAAFQSALNLATLPLSATSNISPRQENIGGGNHCVGVNAAAQSTNTMQGISGQGVQPRATLARSLKQAQSAGGSTSMQWLMTNIEHGSSTVCPLQSGAATLQVTGLTNITAHAESKFMRLGSKIALNFSAMFKHFQAGINRIWSWIGSMSTRVMNLEISGFAPDLKISRTSAESKTLSVRSGTSKPVYDILNAGPRNRFTVLTDQGPIIVHNCILGLGYQMGAERLKDELKRGRGGPSLVKSLAECQGYVNTYRGKYGKIREQWFKLHMLIHTLLPNSNEFVKYRMTEFSAGEVAMPNRLSLYYPGMRAVMNEENGRVQYFFTPHGASKPVKMFGGKLTENIVQCLARIITTEHMLELSSVYRPVLMSHDEIVLCVPKKKAPDALADSIDVMRVPPPWASGLPLEAEGCIAPFYTKPD